MELTPNARYVCGEVLGLSFLFTGTSRKVYGVYMRTLISTIITSFVVAFTVSHAHGQEVSAFGDMAACKPLPRTVQVVGSLKTCGWDDGSSDGQDRNPSKLNDSSASSSPYKTQRRIRGSKQHVLCYGRFLNGKFPVPEQLTIKRTSSPKLDRFCMNFPG